MIQGPPEVVHLAVDLHVDLGMPAPVGESPYAVDALLADAEANIGPNRSPTTTVS